MSGKDFEPSNTPDSTASGDVPAPVVKKPKKWLTAAFNLGSGMAVALAVKTVVVTCAATIASPAATVFIGAAAAGVATSYLRHTLHNYQREKAGEEPLKFTYKKAAMGAGFGMLGAGIISGLDHFAPDLLSNSISSIKNFFGFSSPAVCPDPQPAPDNMLPATDQQVMPEPAPVETAELPETEIDCPPCEPAPSAIDCVTELAKAEGVSSRVHDAISRAASENARVSAQGVKDLGYFLFNGFDGMPKDPCLAVQLLKEAAENGNIQAQVDLAYIEYHGNEAAGIAADPEAALEKMKELQTDKARWFLEQWTGTASDTAAPAPASAAPVPSATPSPAPLQTVTLPASETVVTVDVTGGTTPLQSPAGATIQSGPGMDCQSVIKSNGEIDFICDLQGNDAGFNVGDRVMIQRPALLHLVQ